MLRLLATLLLLVLPVLAGVAPAWSQTGACQVPSTGAKPFEILTGEPGSGAPLTIAWTDPWAAPEACPGARYLVLAMPREVRFSGSGFMALEPGAPAPFGLDFAQDRMRVFIPLHDGDHGAGRLDILPYVTGGLTLDWALAYVPVFLTWAGEPVVAPGESLALELSPGRPRIIVQDPFDVETPTQTILSNDGRFLLEVRTESFRVLNAQTGALVYAGPGFEPNFSPGSRYVHAVGPAIELEEGYSHLRSDLVVVDLYAERPVLRLDGGGGSRSDFVHALHWAWNDSLLFVGHVGAGAVTFRQMLHDDREPVVNAHGCGACTFADGGVAELRGADGVMKLGHGPTGRTFDVVDLIDPSRHRFFDFDALEAPAVPGFGLDDAALVETVDLRSADARSWVLFNPDDDRPPEPVATHRVQDRARIDTAEAARIDDGTGLTRGAAALSKSVGIGAQRRALVRLAEFGVTLRQAPRLLRELTDAQFEALELPEDDSSWDELDYYDDEGEPIEENLRALAARPQNCQAAMPAMVARRLTLDEARTLCAREATALLDEQFDTCTDTEAYVWTLAAAGGVSIIHQRVCRMGSSSAAYGLATFLRHDRDGQRAALLSGHPYLFVSDDWDEDEIELKGILPLFAEAPLAVHALSPNRLAIAGRDRRILVVDPATMDLVSTIRSPSSADDIDLLGLLADGAHMLQLDRDGRFYVYALADGTQTLSGLYVDDELVVMDPDLRYQSTPEGARYVQVKFPGDPVLYSLQNLAAPLKTDRLVEARLGSRARLDAPPAIGRPPQVDLVLQDEARVRLRLSATGGLAGLSVYRDGMRIARTPVSGDRTELEIELPALPETRWFALQATDRKGLSSRTVTLPRTALGTGPAQGRLFVLAVGTDRFDDPGISPLSFAVADARAFAQAFEKPGRYGDVEVETLLDDPDLATTLSARLEAIAARMQPQDTLFLHVAGHGLTDETGRLHLAHRNTRLADLAATALSFDALAGRLAALPGRVMVFLDACHSGAAGTPSNDDAVDVLLRQDRPIAVLAASKGRQFSYESALLRGGAFTGAVVAALARPETDLDGNGVVELDELYAQVKAEVVRATEARQTPWIAQSGFVGPVPLY
ncbi:caspase family protein [Aquibium carbonis]|uniref:Caspase family protein n=1 Tax=Aquibium carbonis TaxID=2495581 RepID=A0A3S0A4L1_9HYPH|nr:caspase family protein [Aquibium carbonis]RST83838.1 caspase family protein [Aquibium carbonis]